MDNDGDSKIDVMFVNMYVNYLVDRRSSYKEIIAEWFLRRSQLYHAASIYADIQNDMRLDSFRAGLNDVFLSFGIKAAAVVMYESPIKEKGRFEYFSFNNKV